MISVIISEIYIGYILCKLMLNQINPNKSDIKLYNAQQKLPIFFKIMLI